MSIAKKAHDNLYNNKYRNNCIDNAKFLFNEITRDGGQLNKILFSRVGDKCDTFVHIKKEDAPEFSSRFDLLSECLNHDNETRERIKEELYTNMDGLYITNEATYAHEYAPAIYTPGLSIHFEAKKIVKSTAT